MRLNLQTDYALRLLMHLAVNEDRLCTIAEAAASKSRQRTDSAASNTKSNGVSGEEACVSDLRRGGEMSG